MPNVIVSDSSCLILLAKLDELDLLAKVYGEIIITPEVAQEILFFVPVWIKIQAAENKTLQDQIAGKVDLGEASAIALAMEIKDSLLIIDDNRAKKLAQRMGIDVTGTFGVLLEAKDLKVIPLVKPFLQRIKETNFRFDENIVLKLAGE